MTHLKDLEFVDFVEGHLAPARARHAEQCGECRMQAEEFRAMLAAVQADEVPEPSPLYWEHFSARVAQAIDAEPRPSSGWAFLQAGRLRWAVAAVAVVLVAGLTWRAALPTISSTPVALAPTQSQLPSAPAETSTADGDDAWQAIIMATDNLALDDTEELGIRVRPGSAERMAEELTAEERTELARLIETELRQTGA